MKSSIKFITIRDITLRAHWTFGLLIAWVAVANIITGLRLATVAWSLFFTGAVLASILLHELAHSYVAAKYGINAKNILLLPIGGVASIEKLPGKPVQEMVISAAGPISNLLIAMMLSVFIPPDATMGNFIGVHAAIDAGNTLYSLFIVNIVLAAVNLIPAFPFDGGRILRGILGLKYNYIRAHALAKISGKVIAGMLLVAGAILLHPLLAGVGLFIILFSGTEGNYLRLKSLFKGLKLKDALMYDYNSLQANMTVGEAANVLDSNHSRYFIVMDGAEPAGTINRMEIIKAMAEMKYETRIQELMKEGLRLYSGETEVETMLDELAAHDERIFLVKNGHFNGVVNFQHIIEHLLLHKTRSQDYGRVRSLVELLN